MDSVLRVQGRIGPRTLLITTAALPLTGWMVHALALHRKLAATRKDPLTGLMRRDAYTARARRLLARHGDDTTVVLVDVGALVGAAPPDVIDARALTRLQRGADAALYAGKHSGRAVLATAVHATVPSINGRRAGRPGTAVWGRAA
ncbi:hypothetical protein ABTX62_23120 [Streptomyces sp. NPDC096046]|uniref:hypothetical protein n=1 Tax=Streptomyces sp. NPDC096046 TaxID=3155542 RepID=UPI003329BD84